MDHSVKGNYHASYLKLLLLFVLSVTLLSISKAGEVDPMVAKKAATNFVLSKMPANNNLKSKPIDNNAVKLAYTGLIDNKPVYYIFNLTNQKGFVIISADDAIRPVLGYSTETSFDINDTKPEGFDSLMLLFKKQILNTRKSKLNATIIESTNWAALTDAINIPVKATTATVGPLMATKWNQGCGYNSLCPVDAAGPCGKTWAGCVAVSMAQVLKYWNHPASGEGSYNYNHFKYGTQSADFGAATYDWASMPNTSSNTEIAKLLYHLGVSVQMNYGTSGSGAYFSSTYSAVTKYFKYSTNSIITSKNSYTDANWKALLKRELDEGRPMMYAGGTHAYVIDGYDNGDYFHVNWGWGGSYDGYFYLNNLKPGGHDYTIGQTALIGVTPANLETPYPESEITEITCGTIISDSTTNGKNRINRYKKNYTPPTGKEKMYAVTTAQNGRLKAKITDLKGKKLNLFILNYPHRDSLLASGDTTVTLNNAKSGKYYIVVDGIYGDEGNFSLKVYCPENKPDLSITKTSISPFMVEPNQSNVVLTSCVKNFGNVASSATKIICWYSEDKILDAGDLKLDSAIIGTLNPGDSVISVNNITIPAVTEGYKFIIFQIDPYNTVVETDEEDNIIPMGFNVLPPSIMDCSLAVELTNKTWFHGNTNTNGNSLISNYGELRGYSGKEIIHTITPKYTGMATLSFSKNNSLNIAGIILTACNENRFAGMIVGSDTGKSDTISTITYRVEKGQTIYLVVDGMQGASGEYWLKANMPDSCPTPVIMVFNDTVLCSSSPKPFIYADYGYQTYQWLNNGFPVIAETNYFTQASESGSYQVEVTENGCKGKSKSITITINSTPKPEIILVGADSLKASVQADSFEWYFNSALNSTYTTQTIKPLQTGVYKVIAINNTCKSEISDGFSYIITKLNRSIASEINISPNPTKGIVYINNLKQNVKNLKLKLYRINGTLILTKDYKNGDKITLDLSNQPAGLYFIELSSNENIKTYKILKE